MLGAVKPDSPGPCEFLSKSGSKVTFPSSPLNETKCEKHQEALKLFCQEDQSPICVVCDRSKEHRAHTVVPAEEAAQEYKGQIRSRLEMLKKEMEGIAALKLNGEITSEELLVLTHYERKKILSEFEKLHMFLEEKELLLLAQLEVLDKEILKRQDEFTTRLTQEISRLGTLISEMEGKCRQPASEFLQVRLCERFSLSVKGRNFQRDLRESNVTLDPDTAHPHLILSEDGKSVRWGPARQDVPDNFRRFDPVPCVLGCEGFTSGRHCWEVEVDGSSWAVGVARESVRRKGGVSLEPEEGIWAVGQLNPIQYVALTSPWTSLPPDRRPRKIRVALDYKGRQVAFFNAENNTEIFTFLAVDGMFWTVGVARESVRRKGHILFRPNTGVLGLQKYHHLCMALTSPSNTYVSLKNNNNEIGIYLDYELGQVSFYDLSNEELLFTFPPVSFNGERVFPYFCVFLSHIKLSPRG
uniref:Uncharacterized protein n=1 Tax=Chelonoidis abingdonii TaxID=106734 RepID=A0A8C0FW83_CHEAB